MYIGSTFVEDSFAEAFSMRYTRILVTAHDSHWLEAAVREFSGYASSVIACDLEIGVERRILDEESPDGRPGVALLAFGFSADAIAGALSNRIGQCVMTCATTAVFDGLPLAETRIPLGKHLRFFGDGYQKSKQVGGRRYWRIPVMDGEFLVEDDAGAAKGVAGGNIIIQADSQVAALDAARRAVASVQELPGVILPFPGGVARSGSKVGSRYKKLKASTADAFCPSLRGRVPTRLVDGAQCALEVVMDGVDEKAVGGAMRAAVEAAAGTGVVAVTAGNYGGKLGKFHFPLRRLWDAKTE